MMIFPKIAALVLLVSTSLLNAQTAATPPASKAPSSEKSASPSQSSPPIPAANQPSPATQSSPVNPKETAKQMDPLDRESPQSAVVAFLKACNAKNYETAWYYNQPGRNTMLTLRYQPAQ